jgi:ankyrin repeat protein
MMEEVLLRFPHIGYQIFEQLDNPFLTVCRKVSKTWKSFIGNEKLPWIRMIVLHIKPLTSSWKIFLKKSNVKVLVEIATSVIQYHRESKCVPENTVPLHFAAMTGNIEIIERLIQIRSQLNKIRTTRIGKSGKSLGFAEFDSLDEIFDGSLTYKFLLRLGKQKGLKLKKENWILEMEIDSFQCTPLHYAARNGHMTAYQAIMEISPNKNPQCGYMTPFHMAAKHGHISVCKLIIDHVEDKNPKNVDDETPLHYAAKGGFLDICQLITYKVIDKNPGDESGNTPLHHAVIFNNLAIFKLIFNNIEDKNPQADDGNTPLHRAAQCGNLEIFRLIFDNIEDKNPMENRYGYTPLHFAVECGHLAICQLIIENVECKKLDWRSYTVLALSNGHHDICRLISKYWIRYTLTVSPKQLIHIH